MNQIQKVTTAALLLASLGIGGFVAGKVASKDKITELENKVQITYLQHNNLKSENYQLHLELIKRGNPYKWELYGDGVGNWGYRKPDESSILGAVTEGYNYLVEK